MTEIIGQQTAAQPVGPTRRVVLGRLAVASAVGTTAAVAQAAANPTDPHVAWAREWRVLLAWVDTPGNYEGNAEDHPQGQRWSELENLLMTTPATTIEGLSAQAEVVDTYFLPDPEDYPKGPLLSNVGVRNLVQAVQRLAAAA